MVERVADAGALLCGVGVPVVNPLAVLGVSQSTGSMELRHKGEWLGW